MVVEFVDLEVKEATDILSKLTAVKTKLLERNNFKALKKLC